MEKRAGQFVALRDKKKEIEEKHKEELRPYNEALEALKSELAAGMDAMNVESVRTPCGTVSFTTKHNASVGDMAAFWTYVVTQGSFDLIDKKANVTAVKDHIDKHGVPPPGVNYNVLRDVGVRRPTGK